MDLPYSFSYLISERTHTVLSCLLALIALAAAFRTGDRDKSPGAGPDWRWIGMIVLLLLVGRWPSIWYPHQLNPDESQLLGGMSTLRFDPVFWRSVNGMTSGPLNFYALWPVGTLLGADSYLSARLTALGLLGLTLSCVHLSVSRRYGATIARVSGLPTVCFLAFSAHPDFTHYSTELLSMALIAVALYLASRFFFEGVTSAWREFTIGFLLGCVPLAKLQASPIAFVLGLALVGWQWFAASAPRSGRMARTARLVGGAFLPVIFTGVVIGMFHLGPYVWITYWLNNRAYIESPTHSIFHVAFRLLIRTDPWSPIYFVWLSSGLAFFALALPWLKIRDRRDAVFIGVSAGLLLVAALSVITPRRAFPHYLMLLPVPWALLCGGFVGVLAPQLANGKRLVATGTFAALGGMVVMLAAMRAVTPYPLQVRFSPYPSDFSGHVIAEIKKYAIAGDALAVWGWRSELHVLSGLRQGARDALTESLIAPGAYQTYFRKLYMDDLARSQPAVFVDGVGPEAFYFNDRAKEAHESVFPDLTAWLRENYTLTADIDGARIYVRSDRVRSVANRRGEPPRQDQRLGSN